MLTAMTKGIKKAKISKEEMALKAVRESWNMMKNREIAEKQAPWNCHFPATMQVEFPAC
jgi:hypothetical protein